MAKKSMIEIALKMLQQKWFHRAIKDHLKMPAPVVRRVICSVMKSPDSFQTVVDNTRGIAGTRTRCFLWLAPSDFKWLFFSFCVRVFIWSKIMKNCVKLHKPKLIPEEHSGKMEFSNFQCMWMECPNVWDWAWDIVHYGTAKHCWFGKFVITPIYMQIDGIIWLDVWGFLTEERYPQTSELKYDARHNCFTRRQCTLFFPFILSYISHISLFLQFLFCASIFSTLARTNKTENAATTAHIQHDYHIAFQVTLPLYLSRNFSCGMHLNRASCHSYRSRWMEGSCVFSALQQIEQSISPIWHV